MNGDNGNKDELSRISSANRHSIANPFDPLNGSYSYNNCHSPVNPFEPAPRPAATAPSSSSPPTNHYHPAAQAHIRSPSPVLMNQHVENLSHSNRRASHAPYYNIRSPPRRANGIGSCYPGSPRLRESSPHLRNMGFAARRASVRDYHDEEAGCHSSQHNDWVMWEQQRLSMARESETRNKRNVALAIVISFVVLVACMVGLGFL
jgi:hypothetical protein